jgi:hypothetical protein
MPTESSGTLEELAGLLVVNPKEGNEEAPPAGSNDAPAKADASADDRAETDWDNAPDSGNPDDAGDGEDGTGDEGQPDEDSGAEAEAAGEEQPEEPLHEITVNGETKKVTLKEALEGYQRLEDYTRKTQEVATQRQALDAELQAAREHRAAYKQLLDTLEQGILPANREPTSEQWEQLKAADPQRYAVEYADFQRRNDQRNAINAEREKVAQQEFAERRKALTTYVDGERVKLFEAMPHWKGADGKLDAKKVDQEIGEIREYAAKNFNYSKQELDAAYDHRLIVAFRKAMLFDKAEAARKAAQGKLRNAPEVPPRAQRVKPAPASEQRRKEAQKRFDKSGRVDDAVELIMS